MAAFMVRIHVFIGTPVRENLSLGNVPENTKQRKGLTHVSDSQSEAADAISPIRAILSMSLANIAAVKWEVKKGGK